jgi:DivIVA domain-containing protein
VVSFFLVFLAIALIGVAILLGTGTASKVFRSRPRAGGERDERGHRSFVDGFDEPAANLPPVLLPARPQPSDVDRLRFGIGLRGYRMDQVDQVLDELRDQLAARDRTVAELEAELERLRTAPEQAVE